MANLSKITGTRKSTAWTTSSAYSDYKKESKFCGYRVRTRTDYTNISRDIFDEISSAIIFEHYEWPFNKGKLAIRKFKPIEPKVDWVATKKVGKRVHFTSIETHGYTFTIVLLKGNHTIYSKSNASDHFKTKLKSHIYESTSNPKVPDYDALILDPANLKSESDYWSKMQHFTTRYKNKTTSCT